MTQRISKKIIVNDKEIKMNRKYWLLISLVAILIQSLANPTVVLAKTIASFTWSLSPRYEKSWDVWTGTTYDPNYVHPKTWRVNFDACSSQGGSSQVIEYSWHIEGKTLFWFPINFKSKECKKGFNLPGQGTYQATLTILTSNKETDSSTRTVIVKDWLIVSIGDSISSGEGNPDTPADVEYNPFPPSTTITTVVWKDRRCHRSALSGPAQTAKALEDADPYTSVTFLSFACSGAEIRHLFSDKYDGQEPSCAGVAVDVRDHRHGDRRNYPIICHLPPQIQAVKKLVGKRQIDALLITAGINDLYFSDIVDHCAHTVSDDVNCVYSYNIDKRLDVLPEKYDALAQAISDNLNVSEVYILDYPYDTNVVAGGGNCGLLHPSWLRFLGENEADLIGIKAQQLNGQIEDAADRNHWNMVHDEKGRSLAEVFSGHGYCSDKNWFVSKSESEHNEGSEKGTLHPNAHGHEAIKNLFLQSIRLGQQNNYYTEVTLKINAIKVGQNTQGTNITLPLQIGGPGSGDSGSGDSGYNVNIYVGGTAFPDLPPYRKECSFVVSEAEFGNYVAPPTGTCTFTLDVYRPPRSPRYAVLVDLTVLANAQIGAVHDYKDNYGRGSHEVKNSNGLLAVRYTITTRKIWVPIYSGPFEPPERKDDNLGQ